MVNLFGYGYVGKEFANKYKCIVQERNSLVPSKDCSSILYTISTIDNYNVKINPYLDIETNLTTLIRVLENFKNLPYSNSITFNFISSWFVYGDTDLPARENSYCDPKGFYSITKRAAEQLLISYCETHNLKYRILRLANVIGGHDTKVSKRKNALTYLVREVSEGNEIQLYDNGDFYRDYISIDDVCQAIDLVLKNGKVNEIYNIGNGTPIRFADLINYVSSKLNRSHLVKSMVQPEFHKNVQVKSMYMDNNKLVSLGYVSKKSVYTILDELICTNTMN